MAERLRILGRSSSQAETRWDRHTTGSNYTAASGTPRKASAPAGSTRAQPLGATAYRTSEGRAGTTERTRADRRIINSEAQDA